MWIWQQTDWLQFQYDSARLNDAVTDFYRRAERLSGQVEALPQARQAEVLVDLMVAEAIQSSAIEGEVLDRASVRSSLKVFAGVSPDSEKSKDDRANGMAALMVAVRQHWDQPLSDETLCNWQALVIPPSQFRPIERGQYRTQEMQIISGPIGREKVHYEAPPPDQVPGEMNRFLDWYNGSRPNGNGETLAGPLRAGVAHLWFEAIHPFEDGNGRVGRAIADHALSQAIDFPSLACLSTAIEADRKAYYGALEQAARGGLDLNHWLGFFVGAVNQAQDLARREVDFVLDKTRFYDQHADQLNERQAKAVARVFREGPKGFEGGLTAKKYMAITDCSKATATRDLTDLLEKGALQQLPGGGRSTRYELTIPKPLFGREKESDLQVARQRLAELGIEQAAIYHAKPTLNYTGTLIDANKHQIIQQVAANTYIVHPAASLHDKPAVGEQANIQHGKITKSEPQQDHGVER